MGIYWLIGIGLFALCIGILALIINITGYKENSKNNDGFAGWNIAFIIILSACIVYNAIQITTYIVTLITV